jgi:RNA polymerase sigma-70 factor (ECF subfamily)
LAAPHARNIARLRTLERMTKESSPKRVTHARPQLEIIVVVLLFLTIQMARIPSGERDAQCPGDRGRGVVAVTPTEIVKEHSRFVWRTLRYLGIAERDVPDVAQEVFITIFRKLAKFEGRSALRSWMYRICQRTAFDHRRRAYVRREVISESPFDEKSGTHWFDGVAVLEARSTLRLAFRMLDEPRCLVLVLHDVEGVSMTEIAGTLECPLQTAYSRLRAARCAVADAIDARP